MPTHTPAPTHIIDDTRGRFFSREASGAIHCLLCHRSCVIADGHSGFCSVRRNNGGSLEIPFYGRVSSVALDPIEKKPLYHFLPGSTALSLGFVGCNLVCPFCQNYRISQSADAHTEYIPPGRIVEIAREHGSPSVAYTYSEPLIHAEYVLDCMKAVREAGLLNILVSNGHIRGEAATEIIALTDGANIDIKSWDPGFYRHELGGDLRTVTEFIERCAGKIHIEATTLVIPGKTDDDAQIRGISTFLASLSPDIVFHLSAYRPMYHYSLPPTPDSLLLRCRDIARECLRFVYVGNSRAARHDTQCPECGATVVTRGFEGVDASGLDTDRCRTCGVKLPFFSINTASSPVQNA